MEQPSPASGSAIYNAAMAMEFFRTAGKPEKAPKGEVIFAENEKGGGFLKRAKMYLVLSGDVSLSVGGKVIGLVRTGEIFGEMASIGQSTRSATATALQDCSLLGLDDKQFKEGLQKKPEFALMMMGLIIARLRAAVARLGEAKGGASNTQPADFQMLDKKLVSASDLSKIADLPSFEALRSQLLGLLTQNAAAFVRVLDAKVKKEQPAAPAA